MSRLGTFWQTDAEYVQIICGRLPRESRPPFASGQDRNYIQLAAYAVLVTKKFRGKVARCDYLFLDHELRLGYEPTDELLATKEAEITALCRKILGDETWEPTPNNLCPWCEYKSICPKGDEWEKSHIKGAGAAEEIPF